LRTILANVLASAARHYHTEGRDLGREYHWQADVDASASRIDGFLAADQTSPSERAVRAEELVRLAQALNQLLPDEKRAVEYHHLRGLPISEVATLMGRTRPAIAGLLFRGLRRLRELLPDQTPRFSG
jgi:RNA polymerase sigma-70 factor (ECF subfamily)